MTPQAIVPSPGPVALDVVNHAWWDDDTFVSVGTLSAETVTQLSGGRLEESIEVRINRLVVESDVTLIVGPVLPHEVVGFSGGHKYLFPGLSGQELIDVTHWLGALITSSEIIGTRGITPVRAVVEAAAALVPGERHALCVVVDHATGGLQSLAFGEPEAAWLAAADVAAQTHVEYLDRPVRRVLSLVSARYPDLWTGAKGFYKVEPIVADGGEVILYAPHIREISAVHPALMDIGYHCRDFFLAQWDRYRHYPRGDLAHATHLFGAGTYDPSAASTSAYGSRWPPGSPRMSSSGPTCITSIRQWSMSGPGRRTPTPWSYPTPAKCSTASADGARRCPSPHSPGYTSPIWERIASSVVASATVSASGIVRALGAPIGEAAVHVFDLEAQPVPFVGTVDLIRAVPCSSP